MTILPGAEPYSHDGGDVAVLLCHGFTGSPQGLRDWGEALAEAGYTVRLPRLPGHGTTWQDMNTTTWRDWYGTVDSALQELAADHDRIVVGGLSMGGALALRLAQRHPDLVRGLVLVNPAVKVEDWRLALLPLLKYAVPALPGISNDIAKPGVTELGYDKTPLKALHSQVIAWRDVVADLPTVTCPILLLRSQGDHVVPASSSALILGQVGSTDTTEVVLTESYHVATLDNDAPLIFRRSIEFVERVAR